MARPRASARAKRAHGLRSALLAFVLTVPFGAQAEPPARDDAQEDDPRAAGRFPRLTPLTLDELYGKRIRFARQEPWLSVGLMDGQSRIALTGSGPIRIVVDDGDLPRTIYAPERTPFAFKLESSTPAEVRSWVIVSTARPTEGARLEAERAAWLARGETAQIFETGTIMAAGGQVLDTRQLELGLVGTVDPQPALDRMRALARDGQREVFLHEELVRAPSAVIQVLDGAGKLVARARDLAFIGSVVGERLSVREVEFGRGYKFHGREDREYWGHLYVVVDRAGKLALVNSVRAERFLRGLVPAEIFADAPLEALKAQAVTARGEIFSKLGHRHFGEPFHLCGEQHCQVYKGAREERPTTNLAVQATRGELAVRPRDAAHEGLVLVDSVYSSSCGGHSEANEIVWGTPPSPSLRPRLDGLAGDPALQPFANGFDDARLRQFLDQVPPVDCARAKLAARNRFRWTRTFTQAELDAIGAEQRVGRLTQVEILGRGPGGRITGLRLQGVGGATEILQEFPVRRAFRNLNSGLFVLDAEKNARGELVKLTFKGGGWGHGVGMCQMGAIGRAERGQTYRQILDHYYSGAVLESLY